MNWRGSEPIEIRENESERCTFKEHPSSSSSGDLSLLSIVDKWICMEMYAEYLEADGVLSREIRESLTN